MGTYDRREREPGYKGNKPFMLDYRDQNGVRQYEGFRTKSERDKAWGRIVELKERGWHPSVEAKYKTFGEALDAYLDWCDVQFDRREHQEDKKEAGTIALYRHVSENHVRPFVGPLTLSQLMRNPYPLHEALDRIVSQLKHVRTPETFCTIVNETIRLAVKKGWLPHNFLLDHPLAPPRKKHKKRPIMSPVEVERLLIAARDRGEFYDGAHGKEKRYAWEYRLFVIALVLSQYPRRQDIAALHWEDVDWLGGT